MDKSEWGDGPWQGEPDQLDWVDEVTGLKCYVLRNPEMGMWLGYVAVPLGHPAFGSDFNDLNLKHDVHGGLTYSHEGYDGSWVLGFDCGHAGDLAPGMQMIIRKLMGKAWMEDDLVYRDLAYVRRECTNLAWQLKQMGEVL